MDRLLSLPRAEFIMGNTDRDIVERRPGRWQAVNHWCADRLTDRQLELLRSLPATFAADDTLFCHGSPRHDTDLLTLSTPAGQVAEWCAGVSQTTIVCGHTQRA